MSLAVEAPQQREQSATARIAVRRGVIVLVAVLLAQAAWILAVPPFRGADEVDHAYRAAGVATGQWHLTGAAAHGRGLLVWVPLDLVEAAHRQCTSLLYTGPDNCSPVLVRGDRAQVATAAGEYNPLFYWLLGTVAKPFHGTKALYAMRMWTAIINALLLALGAGLLALASTGRWTLLALVAAITPQVLYSGIVAAPNGVEMGLGFILWGSLLALDRPQSRRTERILLSTAIAAAVPLAFLRDLGPLWIICIVVSFIALRGWSSTGQLVARHRRLMIAGVVSVGAATSWGLSWMAVAGRYHVPAGATIYPPLVQWSQAFSVPLWLMQMVGAFPLREFPAPLWTYPAYFFVVVLLTWGAWRRGSVPRRSRALFWIVVAALVIPIILSLVFMPTAGAIWQGRYELPFVIGILPLCGLLLDEAGFAPIEGPRLVALSAVLLAITQVACVFHVEQLELHRSPSFSDEGWVHPAPWVTALLMLFACSIAACLWRTEMVDNELNHLRSGERSHE